MVVLPQEEWLNLHEKLDRLAELVTNRNADDRNAECLESEPARKQLGICLNLKLFENCFGTVGKLL